MKKKKIKTRYWIFMGIYLSSVIIYALSWKFPKAVDWYRLHLFPISTNTLARLMSAVPISVGEILIIIGIISLVAAVPIFLFGCMRRGRRLAKGYGEYILWALAWIVFSETFHCFVMYHASTVEETYYDSRDYQEEDLLLIYQKVVSKANELSQRMDRNEKQEVVYSADIDQTCIQAMQQLGKEYPYLAGYYPKPKKILNSNLMSQQYLCGIFFPFTMEANYNTTMYIMNRPSTICHELSHLKGVILEDEANYFGFLACISSADEFLQYSGYLSVLPYISREIRNTVSKEKRTGLIQPNEYVGKDVVFLTAEVWDNVEDQAVIETEKISQATDTFLESNLKTNGVSDGMVSYSRVVRLVLHYYLWEDENTLSN